MLIFIINLKDSANRRESMKIKIYDFAKINNKYDVFLDSKKIQNQSIKNNLTPVFEAKDSKKDSSIENLVKSKTTFNFIFFDATSAKDIATNKISTPNYNVKMSKFIRGKALSYAEIACFSSHYRLWQKCIELDSPIVVIEDDINFDSNFIDSLIDIYNSNIPYVRLICSFDRDIRHMRDNFYMSFSNVSGSQGYFIAPNAALKFISHSKNWFHCVDNYMDMFFLHDVWNVLYKPFSIYDDIDQSKISTIQFEDMVGGGNSKNINKENINKFTREISRFYFFTIRRFLYLVLNFHRIKKYFRNGE